MFSGHNGAQPTFLELFMIIISILRDHDVGLRFGDAEDSSIDVVRYVLSFPYPVDIRAQRTQFWATSRFMMLPGKLT